MRKYLYLGAIAAMVGTAGAAGAVTIVNGSFELGTDPGAGYLSVAAGSSAITGWTVGGFGVDYIGGFWQASDGVRSVDLSLLSAGSLSQAVSTVAGQVYTVTFDLSGNPDGAPASKTLVVSVGGSLPLIQPYLLGPTNTHENMNWSTYSYTFTAFSSSSTLVFSSADFSPYGPALDNVSIVEGGDGNPLPTVPEPASWALMIVGFGLVGIASRRRARTLTA
jgi:choice-of-anchor C domain-containing protein